MNAPLLVLAVGNASRGDDALGPALLQALRDEPGVCGGRVELLEDFQWQPEHALDLAGRQAVLFVDAARGGARAGVQLTKVGADASTSWTTHALPPEAVLAIFERVVAPSPPPAWLLTMQGHRFGLGEALSAPARTHLAQAEALARQWLRDRLRDAVAGHETAPLPPPTEAERA